MSERRWIRNSRPVAWLLKHFARIHIWVQVQIRARRLHLTARDATDAERKRYGRR
jgi:cytidylate kinase